MYAKRAFKLHNINSKKKLSNNPFKNFTGLFPFFVGLQTCEAEVSESFCKIFIDIVGKEKVLQINEESYFKCLKHIPFEKRKSFSQDTPNFIDYELVSKHIDELNYGYTISLPKYDKQQFIRQNDYDLFAPKPVVILTGHYLFNKETIINKLNHKLEIFKSHEKIDEKTNVLQLIEKIILNS